MDKQLSRALANDRAARNDWNEAQHYCPSAAHRERKTAKREAHRATRRAAKLAVRVEQEN